jgi:hypothetical protein
VGGISSTAVVTLTLVRVLTHSYELLGCGKGFNEILGMHTVSFVVARSDHVGLHGRNWSQFVIILVQQAFVDLSAVGNGGVGEEALNFLLEPVVGVGNVTN